LRKRSFKKEKKKKKRKKKEKKNKERRKEKKREKPNPLGIISNDMYKESRKITLSLAFFKISS